MGGSDGQAPAGGHALGVERVIDAGPEAIFDAFIAMYDSQRPDWVTGSQLDLRLGGRWTVEFQVPDGPAFREERVVTCAGPALKAAPFMQVKQGRAARAGFNNLLSTLDNNGLTDQVRSWVGKGDNQHVSGEHARRTRCHRLNRNPR